MREPLTPGQLRRLITRSRLVSVATDPMEVQYLLSRAVDHLETLDDLRAREYERVMEGKAA
jgi:hypothetical protein